MSDSDDSAVARRTKPAPPTHPVVLAIRQVHHEPILHRNQERDETLLAKAHTVRHRADQVLRTIHHQRPTPRIQHRIAQLTWALRRCTRPTLSTLGQELYDATHTYWTTIRKNIPRESDVESDYAEEEPSLHSFVDQRSEEDVRAHDIQESIAEIIDDRKRNLQRRQRRRIAAFLDDTAASDHEPEPARENHKQIS
jgi:hypothetical protein